MRIKPRLPQASGFMNEMTFSEIIHNLFAGFWLTLLLFAVTLVLAIPLGLLMSVCSMSKFKPLKWLTKGIIWVIRGTP